MAATKYQIFIRYYNEVIGKVITNQAPETWVQAEKLENLRLYYLDHKAMFESMEKSIDNGTKKLNEFSSYDIEIYKQCTLYLSIKKSLDKQDGQYIQEYCKIRSYDSYGEMISGYHPSGAPQQSIAVKDAKTLDIMFYDIVIQEAHPTNPKFDMIFMYDGLSRIVYPGWPAQWRTLSENAKRDWINNYTNCISDKAELYPATSGGSQPDKQVPELYFERFKRLQSDPWFFHSNHASLQSAMAKAEELIKILGKEAVKIGKVVPLEQYIEIV